MSNTIHGFSMGLETNGNLLYLTIKVAGKLTHEDYQQITPMIESALAGLTAPKIHALVDITQLEGWELRAAWDDFKLGLKHNRQFEKIALLGNKSWHEWSTKVGGWFVSGEIKYFENYDDAASWLKA